MSPPLNKPTVAVVLVNLGTPDAPTPQAVKKYLRQFLSDTRVIEAPKWLWFFVLNLIIVPFRAKRVAHAYASIWQQDSPMRSILNEQASLLEQQISRDNQLNANVLVRAAMTYGNPALGNVLDELMSQGVQRIVLLPTFPQYSATSTGAVYDALGAWVKRTRNLPSISVIKDYFAHPQYIQALVESIKQFQAQHGVPQKLLFSFHGLPQVYTDKGDPYARRCKCTAAQVAQQLGLADDAWTVAFQSRFGKLEWVKPYTDVVLTQWAQAGVQSVQVVSPAFSADCLETLEELAITNRTLFLSTNADAPKDEKETKQFDYIPALNTADTHIELFKQLVMPYLEAFDLF